MTTQSNILYTRPAPFTIGNGRRGEADAIVLLGQQQIVGSGSAGDITVGPTFDVGHRSIARLRCSVSAKAGTSPTLDVTIQTSASPKDGWQTVAAFAQKTDCMNAQTGPVMGAVTATGTTPPTVTLTSAAQTVPVNFRMECTTLGARGTAVVRYSVDGGITWVSGVTTAATISLVDPDGTDTGVVVNYANATAATDNVWTASTVSYEEKVFTGLNRYVRAVALLGGSSTPTMDVSVSGVLI